MSVRHLAIVADVTGLPPTCKLVLYGLAIAAHWSGEPCAVRNEDLRLFTGLSERAVRDTVNTLVRRGYVERSGAKNNHLALVPATLLTLIPETSRLLV